MAYTQRKQRESGQSGPPHLLRSLLRPCRLGDKTAGTHRSMINHLYHRRSQLEPTNHQQQGGFAKTWVYCNPQKSTCLSSTISISREKLPNASKLLKRDPVCCCTYTLVRRHVTETLSTSIWVTMCTQRSRSC